MALLYSSNKLSVPRSEPDNHMCRLRIYFLFYKLLNDCSPRYYQNNRRRSTFCWPMLFPTNGRVVDCDVLIVKLFPLVFQDVPNIRNSSIRIVATFGMWQFCKAGTACSLHCIAATVRTARRAFIMKTEVTRERVGYLPRDILSHTWFRWLSDSATELHAAIIQWLPRTDWKYSVTNLPIKSSKSHPNKQRIGKASRAEEKGARISRLQEAIKAQSLEVNIKTLRLHNATIM